MRAALSAEQAAAGVFDLPAHLRAEWQWDAETAPTCECVACDPAAHLRAVQEEVAAALLEISDNVEDWSEEAAAVLAANPHDPGGARPD